MTFIPTQIGHTASSNDEFETNNLPTAIDKLNIFFDLQKHILMILLLSGFSMLKKLGNKLGFLMQQHDVLINKVYDANLAEELPENVKQLLRKKSNKIHLEACNNY